ncbi:hypothetical protein BBO_08271 [Beauveria brongniartii RCEF 3172]|uniref:DUF7730 domain-containing protein n=1 Tax=Beauveria brongniartii RCEF 3172 TaxID=1081107 RepID=A0A166Y0F3_9HYPO|nr:hypothetical protein BBO_08271 [Beauveria brongniartii RCEF 3172]
MDSNPPVFVPNLVARPVAASYASPPPSPRLRPHRKPIVQTSPLLLLPAEIRTLILVAAFGHRTIHADLDLVAAPPPAPSQLSTPPDGASTTTIQRSDLIPLSSDDIRWKPTAHPCHRSCFVDRDRCFTGGAPCTFPEHGLASCRIGALGWLLACRQAHAEGVAVLYRYNTFRLNESFALENAPRILPPAHVPAITQLSLSLTMGRSRVASDRIAYPRPRDAVEHLPALLARLPDTFPGLRHLHLVLAGEIWPETQLSAYCAPCPVLHASVEALLVRFEGLVRRWPALRLCEVAFDSSVYFPWLQIERGLEIDFKDYADFEQCPYTVWRSLPADDAHGVESATADPRRLSGFWVCLDVWDAIPWSVMKDLYGKGPW